MSFWDHVEALRMTLFKVIGILVSMAIILFIFMPKLFDSVILAPCDGSFVLYKWLNRLAQFVPGLGSISSTDFHVNLINIQLASQFYIHMSTSFWLALVLSFPIVVYILWQFVCTGRNCIIGRTQESYFDLIMRFTSKEEVRNVARKIRTAIESVRQAGQWSGNCSVVIRASYTDSSSREPNAYLRGLSGLILNSEDTEEL